MGRRHSARQYGQIVHKPSAKPATTEAAAHIESAAGSPAEEQKCILELPQDLLKDIMLSLPFKEALSFGSTCRTLHHSLVVLRPAILQLFLKSVDLAPQILARDWRLNDLMPTGCPQLHLQWTARASWMLYKLAVHEQVAPTLLWTSVIPHIDAKCLRGLMSVRCSFGCTEWICGSLHSQGDELYLHKHLARSDLERMNRHFTVLKDALRVEGVLERHISVTVCKNEPGTARQQDAVLLVRWVDGVMHTNHICPICRVCHEI